MKRVVIIGGGITGLAAAHRIVERSHESGAQVNVTLLEASGHTGGIVQTRERDGFLVESGPDSFISEKPAALELTKRLGLESRLIETNEQNRRSFIVKQRRLLAVPEGFHLLAPSRFWPFFKSDIFSWSGKARMALELAIPRRENGNETDESLAQFVRRRFGSEALQRMAQPMVGGIYTADPERLSLRATMPRFLDMERTHGSVIRALRHATGATLKQESDTSGARYSLFLSFDRGMQVLTDALQQTIAANADQGETSIRLNTTVESLTREPVDAGSDRPLKWKLRTSDNETFVADAVCLALPAYVSSRLLSELDPQLATELSEIPYASSVTVNLAYQREDVPHPLDGFGFVVPFIEKRSLMACTFSSVKFSGRAPQGQVLLRAFVGGALQPELVELSEAELVARVRADLRSLLGIERAPLFAEVKKWERSMPQYHVGHLERVKRIEARLASLPGIVLAGNAYSGLGIPDCIRSGERAAEAVG
ncbi:MAG TPA: protoporphyrinogen oxidase [Pyrinomonadaceae bacterium]|jgi:oxygen-dependent protoporphyrinogen oxidase|nr:protoporphyrinogen oxidase [Pyrinomonadaceae bacterium]